MANTKLTEQQLKELKDYIKTKGFKHPVIVNEILDHFACKVEEVMETDPSLPFYDAVHTARNSFGVMGFAPIVESFTKQLSSKYRKIYWKKFRQTALAPLHIPLLLLLGYTCFKGWLWADANNYRHLLEMNDVSASLMIIYITVQVWIIYKANNQENFYRHAATSAPWILPWTFIYLMPTHNRHHIASWIPALLVALLSIFGLLQLVAMRTTIKAAAEDYNEVKQFFNA